MVLSAYCDNYCFSVLCGCDELSTHTPDNQLVITFNDIFDNVKINEFKEFALSAFNDLNSDYNSEVTSKSDNQYIKR